MSVVPAMLAERLGLPQLTFAKEVTVDAGSVKIKRLTDDGYQAVEASLPAVVSVVEKINEPRYPSFKGIMAAKKKPVETLSLSDLGVDAGEVGLGGAWSAVESLRGRAAAPGRHHRQGRGGRCERARRVPRVQEVRLRGVTDMAEVLVLVDHTDGEVKKVTLELLTLAAPARRAVRGARRRRLRRGEGNARRVRRREGLRRRGRRPLVVPRRAGRRAARAARRVGVARPRCCSSSSAEGKEIAARLALKTGSGRHHRRHRRTQPGTPVRSPSSRSSAARPSSRSKVTTGTPIITVRPNSVAPEADAGDAAREDVSRRRCPTPPRARRSPTASWRRRASAPSSPRPRSSSPAAAASGRPRSSRSSRPWPTPSARRSAPRRAVTDAGWYPHQHQVGQTGKTVSPAALHRGRHLRRDPAPGRHADVQDDRRHQQGPRGADLRARRLRRRRRPAPGRARPHRAGHASARADPRSVDRRACDGRA